MSNYRQILLAIDFLPESERVLQRALELMRQNGAALTLLHVVEPVAVSFIDETPLPTSLTVEQEMLDEAVAHLARIAEQHADVAIKTRVEVGAPKVEILRIAEEEQADLVVVGSHGRHGLELLLGSTANGVLHKAPCDLLAVRIQEG